MMCDYMVNKKEGYITIALITITTPAENSNMTELVYGDKITR